VNGYDITYLLQAGYPAEAFGKVESQHFKRLKRKRKARTLSFNMVD